MEIKSILIIKSILLEIPPQAEGYLSKTIKANNIKYKVLKTGILWKQGNHIRHEYEPGREKTSYANNKGADQPAHPRSLISAFVVRCLDSVMSLVSVMKISSLMVASVAEQASLSLTWSETPEDTFSYDEVHIQSQFPNSLFVNSKSISPLADP